MALYHEAGGLNANLDDNALERLVVETVAKTGIAPRRMLLLPPDHTRLHSRAGRIAAMLYAHYAPTCRIDILPALGTHAPMGAEELDLMFGPGIPKDVFKIHDWRRDVVTLGAVPGVTLRELSGGRIDYAVTVQVNKLLLEDYDLILSLGQVVPHEVVGMANGVKNVLVGAGGPDFINKSHFLGAVCGLERIMGRADTPVRRLFKYAADVYLSRLPIVYLLTVVSRDEATGGTALRGFYSGSGAEPFEKAAALSARVNVDLLERPLKKAVVYLDPKEFKSTWLGNKAIYRTRMAMADGGELIILAPGLKEFGEDPEMDRLIRAYGYRGTAATLKAVADHADLRGNLGAAAHLIHGSSEGRFTITYCPGPGLSASDIESVGFAAGNLKEMSARYSTATLRDGMNRVDGEDVFFVRNPALGLWALASKFFCRF